MRPARRYGDGDGDDERCPSAAAVARSLEVAPWRGIEVPSIGSGASSSVGARSWSGGFLAATSLVDLLPDVDCFAAPWGDNDLSP
jgi:hypothetical protein